MIRIELQLPTVSVYSLASFAIAVAPATLGFLILRQGDDDVGARVSSGVLGGLLLAAAVLSFAAVVWPLRLGLLLGNLFAAVGIFATLCYWLSRTFAGLYLAFVVLAMLALLALTAFLTFGVARYLLLQRHIRELERPPAGASPGLSSSTATFSENLTPRLDDEKQPQTHHHAPPLPPPPEPQPRVAATETEKKRVSLKKSASSSLTINNDAGSVACGHLKDKTSSHSLLSFLHGSDSAETKTQNTHHHHHHHRSESILNKIPQSLLPAHLRTESQTSNLQQLQNPSSASLGFDNWDLSSLSARERMMWTLSNMNSETNVVAAATAGSGYRNVSDGSSRLSTKTAGTNISTNQNALINRAGFSKEERELEKPQIKIQDHSHAYSLYDQERLTKDS